MRTLADIGGYPGFAAVRIFPDRLGKQAGHLNKLRLATATRTSWRELVSQISVEIVDRLETRL